MQYHAGIQWFPAGWEDAIFFCGKPVVLFLCCVRGPRELNQPVRSGSTGSYIIIDLCVCYICDLFGRTQGFPHSHHWSMWMMKSQFCCLMCMSVSVQVNTLRPECVLGNITKLYLLFLSFHNTAVVQGLISRTIFPSQFKFYENRY